MEPKHFGQPASTMDDEWHHCRHPKHKVLSVVLWYDANVVYGDAQMMDQNPELAQFFNNPEMLQESLQVAQNPVGACCNSRNDTPVSPSCAQHTHLQDHH